MPLDPLEMKAFQNNTHLYQNLLKPLADIVNGLGSFIKFQFGGQCFKDKNLHVL